MAEKYSNHSIVQHREVVSDESLPMNKRCKIFIKLAISIALVGYLFWSINLDGLYSLLLSTNIVLIVIAMAFSVPGIYISTVKWQMLLKAQGIYNPSFFRLWALYYMGMFFSNFLPTEVGGDIVRSYNVGSETGKQTESLAAVTMERVTGFTAIVIIAVIGFFLNFQLSHRLHLSVPILISLALVALTYVFLSSRGFARRIKDFLYGYNSLIKVTEKLESFYNALNLYKGRTSVLLRAMIISVFFQCLIVLTIYVTLLAMHIGVSFVTLLLLVPMITLIGVLPVTINGIGLREGAFVYLFSQVGMTDLQSLALALLFRVSSLLPSLVGGCMYMLNISSVKKNDSCN